MQEISASRDQMVQSHDSALKVAIRRTDEDFGVVLGALSSIVETSVAAHHQLVRPDRTAC
jgi:hypothetical protein